MCASVCLSVSSHTHRRLLNSDIGQVQVCVLQIPFLLRVAEGAEAREPGDIESVRPLPSSGHGHAEAGLDAHGS